MKEFVVSFKKNMLYGILACVLVLLILPVISVLIDDAMQLSYNTGRFERLLAILSEDQNWEKSKVRLEAESYIIYPIEAETLIPCETSCYHLCTWSGVGAKLSRSNVGRIGFVYPQYAIVRVNENGCIHSVKAFERNAENRIYRPVDGCFLY